MLPLKIKKTKRTGPESLIQDSIVCKLTLLGWYCVETHGNIFQFGLPDILATHSKYGLRLIEVKNPLAYSFTAGQLQVFPKLVANGTGVWILVSDSDDEIAKLFKPCNWYFYLKY